MPGKIDGIVIGDVECRVAAECPYCGFKQEMRLGSGTQLVICDCDNGGCDRYYVARIIGQEVCGETLKIEGEED